MNRNKRDYLIKMKWAEPLDYIKSNNKYTDSSIKRLIISLQQDYLLPNEIINLLMEYVMLRNNGTLSHSLIIKIAEQLNDQGINNLKAAMDFINKLHQQYLTKNDKQ